MPFNYKSWNDDNELVYCRVCDKKLSLLHSIILIYYGNFLLNMLK